MSYKPPLSVAFAAKKGLELRHFHGRGGTAVGIRRAWQLLKREKISIKTIKRMYDFFNRHQKNKDNDPKTHNGKIAWLLWGGDAGRRWSKKILKEEGYLD